MAEIKGITIELEGDASGLLKAINKVRTETRGFDKELGYINKSLQFNPRNVDLLRQKIAVLTDATNAGQKNIDDMKKALAEMKAKGVDETSAEYRELEREIIKAESKQKEYNAELRKVKAAASGLGQAAASMKEFGNKATAAGNALKGVSAAAAGIDAALVGLAYKSGQTADELNTMAKVTGISTQELQKYKAAADLVDVSVETIAKSQIKLKRSMNDASQGSSAMSEAFDLLGVSVTDANGQLRGQDEVFSETIAALGKMENETQRDALAMKIFGKSASELNPLIEDNGETYKRVADVFARNNLQLVDQETLDKANAFNDTLDELKATGAAALSSIGMQLAGYLQPALEKIAGAIEKVFSWLSQLDPEVLTVIGIIAGVVAALAPVLLIVGKLAFAISSIMSLMSTIGPVIAGVAGPIGIAIAAIAGLIAAGVAVYKNWDVIKEKASAVWNTIKTTVNTVITNIKTAFNNLKASLINTFNSIKQTAQTVWTAIKLAITHPVEMALLGVRTVIEKIKGLFSNFNIKLPHIKLPHFSISPPGWKIGDLLQGKIPKLGISWYDKGGIFKSPSIIGVGEKRPEFVGALDDLRDIVRQETGAGITINVYGSEGMNVNDLALEVQRRIIELEKRRKNAWA